MIFCTIDELVEMDFDEPFLQRYNLQIWHAAGWRDTRGILNVGDFWHVSLKIGKPLLVKGDAQLCLTRKQEPIEEMVD